MGTARRKVIATCCASLFFVVGGVFLSGAAEAAWIYLSDLSSEDTISANDLTAKLDFSVSGSVLTLEVTNESSYDINQLYFNAADENTELTWRNSPPSGWSLSTDQAADGFGLFDFCLDGGLIHNRGPSQLFTFDISPTDAFADTEFTTSFSTIPPGNRPALAAAKFINGGDTEDGESAFGAAVPIPGSIMMLGSGLVALVFLRRKKIS
jgi:hypothetical protein